MECNKSPCSAVNGIGGVEMILFTFVLQENIPKEEGDSLAVDESLFQRIGTGDTAALDDLYHLTERALYAFCVSVSRDHEL